MAHNALPTAATGLCPFHVIYGYQPRLFPVNEEEVTVPSAHAMARRCRKVWVAARQMLLSGAGPHESCSRPISRLPTPQDRKCGSPPKIFHSRKLAPRDISIQHWAVPAASLPTAKKNCHMMMTDEQCSNVMLAWDQKRVGFMP
ncbi:hypothetical protein L3Q82_004501 [Scortum barcoo]|uniref:Uncharacterized protein n=1 Tax=Scortum barcoo TaxID=214431 RepID=A0ACB8VGT2_9TELE|nr:hypothetical protein L3Q82_004501 [Scortum barcoo]